MGAHGVVNSSLYLPAAEDRRKGRTILVLAVAAAVGLTLFLMPQQASAEQATSHTFRAAAAAVDVGAYHSCALLDNGRVRCWGRNSDGQLGLGHNNNIGDNEPITSASYINFGAGRKAAAIAVGRYHGCAILDNGRLRCWGDNGDGQLGLGHNNDIGNDEPITSVPYVNLGAGRKAVAIAAGAFFTCAILDNGRLRCWGGNSNGQLGLGHNNDIGDNEPITSVQPVNLGSGRKAMAVTAGDYHTCVILDNGRLRCWGENSDGQLGLGHPNAIGDDEPVTTAPLVNLGAGRKVRAVKGGYHHTCAILDNNRLRCWGYNQHGQLGLGHNNNIGDNESITSVPYVNLGSGRRAVSIEAADYHSCAILDNNRLRCWGFNSDGQLGLGHEDDIGDNEPIASVQPVNLGAGRTARAVSGGYYHTCASLDNGRLRCWGDNQSGQLGLGNVTDIGDNELPVTVAPVPLGAKVMVRAKTKLQVKTKPKRDRKAPYKFKVRGKLVGKTLFDYATCSGKVRIKAKRGGKNAGKKVATLKLKGRNCTYKTTLKTKKKRSGKLKVVATKPRTSNLVKASKKFRVRAG